MYSSSGPGLDGPQLPKTSKLRGLIGWAFFGAVLIFLVIMTSVHTRPKEFKAASLDRYLNGTGLDLYKGLGDWRLGPNVARTRKQNALASFMLGLKLLHVFWYDLAADYFKQAQAQDPTMVMAYWGEAMCYKQPLWQTEDVAKAQAVLARLDASNVTSRATPAERGYIAAVKLLFAPDTELEDRETDYTTSMESLYQQYQEDPDACAFYALSLLGQLHSVGGYLSPEEVERARDTVDEVLGDCTHHAEYQGHTGLLHYQVYLYDVDEPDQAAKGIPPALALAKLAPASSRAEHMRSHIFIRFGNWSQVVDSNADAVAASDKYCTAANQGDDCDADNRYHALEWQLYGLTQQCAFTKARTLYARMQTVAAKKNNTGSYGQWLYRMYAHMQLQSMQANGAVALLPAQGNGTSMTIPQLYGANVSGAADISDSFWPPHAEAHAQLARAYALVYNRTSVETQAADVQGTLRTTLARIDAVATAASAAPNASPDMVALLATVQLQASAMVMASACANKANGSACDAFQPLMDQAMDKYETFYSDTALPTLKIAPTPEFYGNLLLLTGRNASLAAAMYDRCLQDLPGRMQCVLGRARAARALGDFPNQQLYYTQLKAQCAGGDARFPAYVEALAGSVAPPPPPKPRSSGRRLAAR